MATTTKEILAKLKLDSKEFIGKLDESHKSVLKVTAGLTAVSAAVIAATKMTANYRDETVKAARVAGSTAEDFSALRHAADLSGVSMEQLTKGLQKLNDPSAEAKKALSSLGVSMQDSSGKMKTQNEVLADLADKMSGLESPAQKSAAAVAIFGSRGASMVNMLAGGSAGIRQMTEEAERMGLTFDEQAGAASELFNDNITRLTSSVKGMVMSFTDGIIELVNTSGIMTSLAGIVQSVTGWWKSLDESTRSTITTVGAVVAGVAALVLVLAGVIAIAPAVTAAITAMTGGLNLVVLAVALAVAAFAAIAVSAAKYWDQVKSAILPAVDAITEAIDDLAETFEPIGNSLSDFGSYISDATGEVSILGTVAKAAFAIIGSAIVAVIGAFRLFADTISLLGTAIYSLGEAFYQAIVNQDFNAAKAALGRIGDAAIKLKDDFVNIGYKIKASFSNIVVTVDTKAAKSKISGLGDDLNRLGGSDGEPEWIKGMKKWVGTIGSFITGIASEIGKLSDMVASRIQEDLARSTRQLEIVSGLYANQMEALIETTEAAEDEKISRMSEKYDAEIAALEDAERRKNSAIEFASNERLLMLDEEYQAAKELAEQEFEARMEREAEQYEIEKEGILQKAIDKEQRMITEQLMDRDFKNYMANQQAMHNQKLEQLAASYATKTKTETAALKAAQTALETESANTIKALTEQKNADIEASEAAKNAKLQALEEKKASDEKKMKKAQILMSWKAEQSEFKSTQGMKIAQTLVTGIAGAAQAFAMAAGSIPIVGVILGAVLAAAVLAMTFASVAQLSTQSPPSAPAALFLASGGVMAGPSHAQGGISATLEGGEGVIDRARTERLLNSVDNATSGRGGVNIYFEQGSIVNNGKDVTDSFMDQIADRLARKLERQGVYA